MKKHITKTQKLHKVGRAVKRIARKAAFAFGGALLVAGLMASPDVSRLVLMFILFSAWCSHTEVTE